MKDYSTIDKDALDIMENLFGGYGWPAENNGVFDGVPRYKSGLRAKRPECNNQARQQGQSA